jgi:hypothetical protein
LELLLKHKVAQNIIFVKGFRQISTTVDKKDSLFFKEGCRPPSPSKGRGQGIKPLTTPEKRPDIDSGASPM